MQQAEVYHIYHLGEQRGPYSARQVNHLYRCGYVSDDALYWRDGMEQWQPISEIVEVRVQRNKLRKWVPAAVVAGAVAALMFLFGPVTLEAWRELTSGDFTQESAWWRARGILREKHPEGSRLIFLPYSAAEVRMIGKDMAEVNLGWEKLGGGDSSRETLALRYDAERRSWVPLTQKAENAAVTTPPPTTEEPLVPATSGITSSSKTSNSPAIQ